MFQRRISMIAFGLLTILALGFIQPFAAGEESTEQESAIKRSAYAVQNRTAVELADLLNKHFKDVVEAQPDSASNALLIRANAAVMDDVMKTLAFLDRRPREVSLDFFVIHTKMEKGADGKTEFPAVDAKDLTGQAERVIGKINALEKQAAFTSLERFQIKALENQAATVKDVENKPYTTGAVTTTAVDGKPRVTRTVAYKTLGTTITVTPQVGKDKLITLDFRFSKEHSVPASDVPLVADQNGPAVVATQFLTASLQTKLVVADGQAVPARDVQVTSGKSGERIIVVVIARVAN
jgi:type II secretory pathway component GspD/PulD (secretin)